MPIVRGGELTAITLFLDEVGTERPRPMGLRQINFLKSLSAVLSMALTNLYNRSYFEEKIRRDFENCRHADLALLMISFDDFYLYNELYGTQEGDRIVQYVPQSEKDKTDQNLTEKRALAESCAGTIYALTAAIDAKDHYTFNHSNNVAEYAAVLAAAIPLDAERVEIIRQAGLLHDIGKIGIPEGILSKKGALTEEEYEIMKQHVEGSIAMIRYLPSLDYVIPSAIGHHERWDGKGYMRGIAGEAIPIGARCLCIVDSFDAMVTRRSYKSAMSVADALQEIRRNLGTQFDPQLGQLFIRLVEGGKITPHLS